MAQRSRCRIIMRRDYAGTEVKITYDNTFNSDTATRKLDLIAGRNFNEGRTSLLVTANFSDANSLLLADRELAQRGLQAIWNNNPSYFLSPNSPPLGATPNVVSSDGSDLVLDNGTKLNSTYTSIPIGYTGPLSDGGAALASNAGAYNWDLAQSAQLSHVGSGQNQALYVRPTVKYGALALRHRFDKSLQVFADLSSSKALTTFPVSGATSAFFIPGDSPNNPFSQDIQVSLPLPGTDSEQVTDVEHHRALVGLVRQLWGGWQLGADYTWDRTVVTHRTGITTPAFAGAVASGTVGNVLRDTNSFMIDIEPYVAQGFNTSPFESTMRDATLRISGPVGNISGGTPVLSASLAHRNESVADSFLFQPAFNFAAYYPSRNQSVTSAYLEFRVPVFSDKNAKPGLRELELQIAVRRDDYTSESGGVLNLIGPLPSQLPDVERAQNTFSSVDPTVALRWSPWQDLALRASYGTGFLPPGLNQLVPTIRPNVTFGIDPLRGNTQAGPYTSVSGGNPSLVPEQSESWSAGLIFTPGLLPNLRVSIDYTRIGKEDNIAFHPDGRQGVINDEALLPGRVVRGPNLPNDPPGWAGPITLVDFGPLNLATAELEAWDLQLEFRKDAGRVGTFDLFFMGTWQPAYETRILSSQPEIDHVGLSSENPLKLKANAGLTWSRSRWHAGWNISHFDAYQVSADLLDVANQGALGKIPSQTYHDVFVNYRFDRAGGKDSGWMRGAEVQLGVQNVFNKEPPLDVANNSGGFYSRFGDPRLSVWYLSIAAEF